MNTFLYARVSTDKQAEKALSIPAQLHAMRDYARQHGWTVVEEFLEPGASAKTADRPALQRLLSAIKESSATVDVVLVHKIDRLARNVYDHATMRALLQHHQVRLASVVENVDDTVPGQLVENIMASIAQFYSANLSEETKKGMRQKVLDGGWPHKPPRGYVTVKSPGAVASHVEPHPREGPLVRRAFELYATGWYSMQALGRHLAKAGLVSRSGGPIPKSQLYRMLTNPFYIGQIRWKDLDVPGRHAPLVSEELAEKVRTVIQQRYRNPGPKTKAAGFPLRGLATCASCRGRMSGEWHDRWGYYRCSRQSYRREVCNARMCNQARAHKDLDRILKQTQITRRTADAIQEAADTLLKDRNVRRQHHASDVAKAHAALVTTEMRLTDAFTSGDVSPEVFKAKTLEIKTKRATLDADLQQAAADPAALSAKVKRTLSLATSLWDLYERLADDKRAELLRTVFRAVVVERDGIVGHALHAPFDTFVHPQRSRSESQSLHQQATAAIDAA